MDQKEKIAVIQIAATLSPKKEDLVDGIKTVMQLLEDKELWKAQPSTNLPYRM